eukprot:CAMPEP_0196575596 /NCGR_PEP_ID=MMETSP1081-20130531/5042_1 /TAXON_ID=36882 /ORGANISM="Pyramimonas amylifera, Strain CCMP720" /LENGTH=322 /DNA_ID=CAMNT_0041893949 /DNA_START=232 /DNA_END=1200 /DNA_ORIENTATION=-
MFNSGLVRGTVPLHFSQVSAIKGTAPKEDNLERLFVEGFDESVGNPERKKREGECLRFPYTDPIQLDNGLEVSGAAVLQHLSPLIQDGRRAKFEEVASQRTFNVVPVVEGLYDMGNVAAVCRSAEAMGFGQMHVIKSDDNSKYKTLKTRRCSAGSEKWVHLERWDSTQACLTHLKQQGFKILVTHLEASQPLDDFDWTQPTAVLFGNERDGVSDVAVEMADARVCIPMVGFTESYNISVASALVLYHAFSDRMRRQGFHGDMTDEQKELLTAIMFLRHKHTHQRILTDMFGSPDQIEYFKSQVDAAGNVRERRQITPVWLEG